MHTFHERIKKHEEHIKSAGEHCNTEETTKQALILPLLDILGFSPFDPTRVKAEYGANFPGAKSGERVDYALFCNNVPVMFIEAKSYNEKLVNHCPQLSRYFNAAPQVTIAAITNGKEWRFFTDMGNKNIMDEAPFLTLNFEATDKSLVERLYHFKHDQFHPETLRALAEETVYLNTFTQVISQSLRETGPNFVRFVASHSGIQRSFTAKFLETITPIVKQAVERSVSDMVVSGLSARPPEPTTPSPAPVFLTPEPTHKDIVDPGNPKIITTVAEQKFFEVVQKILGDKADICAKDTETYFSILFQGKTSRWLMRYYADKRSPYIQVCVPMTEERKREVKRAGMTLGTGDSILLPTPEHLFRISGIIFDTLAHITADRSFKHQS